MARKLTQDDAHLTVLTFAELSDEFKAYARQWQRSRHRAGREVPSGERRGHNHMVSRILYWILSLSDEDRERIQKEGGKLYDRLFEMPEGYMGPLPLERRTESVFRPADTIDSGRTNGEDVSTRKAGGSIAGRRGFPEKRRGAG